MSRARKKLAKPYVDARGVPLVSISTSGKRRFAAACLITMTQRDGRDRSWMLRAARSIDVPTDIIAATRARLATDLTFAGRRAEQEDIEA